MTGSDKDSTQGKANPNEGEGNRTAAKEYNRKAEDFAKSGKVKEAAEKAEDALDGDKKKELENAEKQGQKAAKERDPNVARNYSKGK